MARGTWGKGNPGKGYLGKGTPGKAYGKGNPGKGYQGNCYNCGKKGHKSAECRGGRQTNLVETEQGAQKKPPEKLEESGSGPLKVAKGSLETLTKSWSNRKR